MDKIYKWGATFSVEMLCKHSKLCKHNKGILSIPIYSFIDNKQKIKIEKISISKYNDIEIKFSLEPSSKPQNISYSTIEDANHYDTREEGFRENYNERYD
jgi:hypothetical protein